MTRRKTLRTGFDFNEIDMLFDLELEEQQLRVAALRVASNRKLEDVDYWRKHSGWFDDDESMKEYNTGVYTSYYSIDDDHEGGMGIDFKPAYQICGVLVLFVILVVVVRKFTHTSTRQKRRTGTDSSPSRKKSRSNRRTKESGVGGAGGARDDNYELMENNKSQTSNNSSRSKTDNKRQKLNFTSRSKASRSKSYSPPSSRRELMWV